MAHKNIPQHHAKRKFHFRTFFVNGAYIGILEVTGMKGGFTAWGENREDAIKNVLELGGRYIKTLDL